MFMAGRYDFTINQGSTFSMGVKWKEGNNDANLTGYSGRMQIRYKDHNGQVAANLDDSNGGVTLDMFNGMIKIYISAEDTAKIKVQDCVYDLEMVQDDYVVRLLEGKVRISPEVTK